MASSTERMRGIELFELQADEGPCHDALRTGEQLTNVDLDISVERWPRFSPRALALGYHTAHALPMRLRHQHVGAMNVFDTRHRELSVSNVSLAQALVDVATIGILQQRARRHDENLAEELSHALNSRTAIEQAKGVVAERLGVGTDEAFRLLRGYARRENRLLTKVASDVIDHHLPASVLHSTKEAGVRPDGAA